jgi:hypothetical protein
MDIETPLSVWPQFAPGTYGVSVSALVMMRLSRLMFQTTKRFESLGVKRPVYDQALSS